MEPVIEVGDHVRYSSGKVHWVVEASHDIMGTQGLVLVSPFSGRTVTAFANEVELVKKGEKNVFGEFDHVPSAVRLSGRR